MEQENHNKFAEMWKIQKEFQKHFYDPDNINDESKIVLSKEFILSMHRELGEVLNEMPWKLHRSKDVQTFNPEHIQEELIDCFKFLINVGIVWGLNEETFYQKFLDKSAVVEQRFNDENI